MTDYEIYYTPQYFYKNLVIRNPLISSDSSLIFVYL
jgi:hypothetical protein